MEYAEFIKKRIFEPLGMHHSYYGDNRSIIQNRAYGYSKGKAGFEDAEYINMSVIYAAGSLMMTTRDLLTWNKAILHHKLISEASTTLLFTNYTTNDGKQINYGYGWGLGNLRGSKMIHHGGNINGYSAMEIWLPDEDVFVSMLTKRDDFSPDGLAYKLAAYLIGKPFPEQDLNIVIVEDYTKKIRVVYKFEDDAVRYIMYKDGQLYSQRQGWFQH